MKVLEKLEKLIPKMLILLAVMAALLVIASTFIIYKSLGPKNTKELPITIEYEEMDTLDIETLVIEQPFFSNLKYKKEKKKNELDHLAVVEISYEVYNKDGISEKLINKLQYYEPIIKSKILEIIRTYSFDEMNRENQRDILSSNILEKLQNIFNTKYIIKVNIDGIITD